MSDQDQSSTPLAYRAVQGGAWVALSFYWIMAFGLVANIFLTRILSPSVFGTFAMALFFMNLFRVSNKIGVSSAFTQHNVLTGESVGTFFYLEVIGGLVSIAVLVIAVPALRALGYATIIMEIGFVLVVSAAMESVGGVFSRIVEGQLFNRELSLIRFVFFPLSYVPAFLIALNGGGVWSLVAQNLTWNIFLLLGSLWCSLKRVRVIWGMKWRLDGALVKRYVRFGASIGLGVLGALMMGQLDNFYIGSFVGVAVLGLYDRAYRIAEWPQLLFNALSHRIAFFAYAQLQDDRERLEKTLSMVFWIMLVVTIPVGLSIFAVAPELVRVLYGEKWAGAAFFLRILVVFSVFKPLFDNAGWFFIATGQPKTTTKLNVAIAAVLLILGYPFTIMWGAVGTCAAVGAAYLTGVVLMHYVLARVVTIKFGSLLGAPISAGLITLAAYAGVAFLLPRAGLSPLVSLLCTGGAVWVVYLSLVLLFQPRMTTERVRYVFRLLMAGRGGGQ